MTPLQTELPLPAAPQAQSALKIFQVSPRKGSGNFILRVHYRRSQLHDVGLLNLSFNTEYTLDSPDLWDARTNRLHRSHPEALRINAGLDRLYTAVLEAIDAGLSAGEIRELVGADPAGTRRHFGRISSPRRPRPRLPLDAAPEPTPAPSEPAPSEPAPSDPAPSDPAPREFWQVACAESPTELTAGPFTTPEAAHAAAHSVATLLGATHLVYHCRPVARVQVLVHVESL